MMLSHGVSGRTGAVRIRGQSFLTCVGVRCIFRDMSKHRRIPTEHLAEMLKALAHPHRLSIFIRLANCCAPGTMCDAKNGAAACVGELGDELGVLPSTLSHHIKELCRAGLIRTKRRGRRIMCGIDPQALGALSRFFDDLTITPVPGTTPKRRKTP
jgi:ArsR family transcriptional regulator